MGKKRRLSKSAAAPSNRSAPTRARSLEDLSVLRAEAEAAEAEKASGTAWLPDRYRAFTDLLQKEMGGVQGVIADFTEGEKKWPFTRRKTVQDAVLWARTSDNVPLETVFGRYSIAANEQHGYLGKVALLQFAIDRIVHAAERMVHRAAKATRNKKALAGMASYAKAADGSTRLQPIVILGELVGDMVKAATESNAKLAQMEARALEAEATAHQAKETARILQEVLTKREEGKPVTNVSINMPAVAVSVTAHGAGELEVRDPGRDVATQTQDLGQFCAMCFDIGKKIALIQRIAFDMLTGSSKPVDVRRPSVADLRRTEDGGEGRRQSLKPGDAEAIAAAQDGRLSLVIPDATALPTEQRRQSLKPGGNDLLKPSDGAGEEAGGGKRSRSGSARHDPIPTVAEGVQWLSQHAKELERVREYIKARERDIETLRADVFQSRDKIKKLDMKVARLESDMERVTESRDSAAKAHAEEIARLRQNNAEDLVLAEKRRQAAVMQERKCTDNAFAQLAAMREQADKDLAKERAHATALANELKQLQTLVETEGMRLSALQDAVRERDALRIQIRTREAELEEQRGIVQSYQGRIATIDHKEAMWRQREEELCKAVENLTNDLQIAQLSRQSAALDADMARKDAGSSRQEMERMRAKMDEEVRRSIAAEEARRSLEDQVAYLEETIERLRIQIAAAGSVFPLVEEFDRIAIERGLTDTSVSAVHKLVQTNAARIGQLEEKNERLRRMIIDDAEGKRHRSMPRSTAPMPLWNSAQVTSLFAPPPPAHPARSASTPEPEGRPSSTDGARKSAGQSRHAGEDDRRLHWEMSGQIRPSSDAERTTITQVAGGRRPTYIPKLVSLTGTEDLGGHVTRVADTRSAIGLPAMSSPSGRSSSPTGRRVAHARLPTETS